MLNLELGGATWECLVLIKLTVKVNSSGTSVTRGGGQHVTWTITYQNGTLSAYHHISARPILSLILSRIGKSCQPCVAVHLAIEPAEFLTMTKPSRSLVLTFAYWYRYGSTFVA